MTTVLALLLAGCSSMSAEAPRPVSEPAAAVAPAEIVPVVSVEFPDAPPDGTTVEVTGEVPFLLDGDLMLPGSRKLVRVADKTAFEVLIAGGEFHLPRGTMTLTVTPDGWEIEGPVFFSYPPDSCEAVQGGLERADASNLLVNFGISCGSSPDIGKFSVSSCDGELETFHHGIFSGGPLFALTQYGRSEQFVVPPGESWEIRYAEDHQTFAVQ